MLAISNTFDKYTYVDYDTPLKKDQRKVTVTITVNKRIQIIKEENNETKPE